MAEPGLEFRELTEAAVLAALDDPDPKNLIAVEVARLVASYTETFQRYVDHLGRMPDQVRRTKGRWPIEEVAMRLTSEAISEAMAKQRSIN